MPFAGKKPFLAPGAGIGRALPPVLMGRGSGLLGRQLRWTERPVFLGWELVRELL